MTTVPPSDWLVSVDDHVIEPPKVWLDRLPSKYHDRAPRMAKGERGAVWWTDGAPDLNRHKVAGSPYAEWWARSG